MRIGRSYLRIGHSFTSPILTLFSESSRIKRTAPAATPKRSQNRVRSLNCPPVVFDVSCVAAVRTGVEKERLATREIVSGPGHDAVYVSKVVPTSMIFVPCAGGLSHNEAESITQAGAQSSSEADCHWEVMATNSKQSCRPVLK